MKKDEEDSKPTLKVVDRALMVLEYILEYKHREVTVTGLSTDLHINKTVIYRILQTLMYRGYLVKNERYQTYSPGFKLIELGSRTQEKIELHSIVRPYLEELSQKTGETVNLGVLTDNQVAYLDKIESNNFLRTDLRIGTRVPIYCSALGKAILSHLNDYSILENIEFEQHTSNTIKNKQELISELKKIREQGYCLDDEEYIPGVRCIAVPILAGDKRVEGALSVAGPTFRLSDERFDQLVHDLKLVVSQLNRKLRY